MSESKNSGCTSMPVVILALLFFWPLGLVLMWTGKTFNFVIRVIITLFFLGTIFISLAFGLLAMAPGCEGLPTEIPSIFEAFSEVDHHIHGLQRNAGYI